MELGARWAEENLDFRIEVKAVPATKPMVVMNGNQALGMGAMAAGLDLCAMYPITPATSVSHYLGDVFESVGGIVHQAEDEIAPIGAAIGASYAGKVAFTVTSGPGLALKTEGVGLAIMTELPMVIVDLQRGGPSTGLPTKTEQADLNMATVGRNSEAPCCVLAPSTPADCFNIAIEAYRIATEFMTPVIILRDGYLANGAEPWRIPDPSPLPKFNIRHPVADGEFQPYKTG